MMHLTAMLAGFLVLGALLGAAHFKALRRQVRAIARRGAAHEVALPFLRFLLSAAGLIAAATHGADALLATAAGFLGARAVMLHRMEWPA